MLNLSYDGRLICFVSADADGGYAAVERDEDFVFGFVEAGSLVKAFIDHGETREVFAGESGFDADAASHAARNFDIDVGYTGIDIESDVGPIVS